MADRIRVLLTEEEVDKRINEVAAKISEDYAGKQVHMICILKGGVFFTCELAKRMTVPVSLDFMSVSSYGGGTVSSGVVRIVKDLDESLEGKDVLIVEDIIDSGRTLAYLIEVLKQRGPKSIHLCTLLDKPERRVKKQVKVDYTCFTIPDEFVVRYIVQAADSEGRYSHTGILKKERGAWYVIHAVPGEPDFKGDADRIKMEPVERFFDAGKASRGAVMHVQADSALACRAARSALGLFRKHLLFDHDYDLNDTTEMYCTELIDYVYRKEGIDLSEGRTTSVNIPGMSGDYLMPNDIAQSGRLCLIYCF